MKRTWAALHMTKCMIEMCIHTRMHDNKYILQNGNFLPTGIIVMIYILSLSNLVLSAHITLFFSASILSKHGQSEVMLESGTAFIFMPYDWNRYCISTYQQQVSPVLQTLLMTFSVNLNYQCLGTSKYIWNESLNIIIRCSILVLL